LALFNINRPRALDFRLPIFDLRFEKTNGLLQPRISADLHGFLFATDKL